MTTILVIEDEEHIREDILFVLQHNGYEAIGAANGEAGIAAAHLHLPDLIVCDIMMPGALDGYAVLEQLRKVNHTARIPFIFLTARADKADVRTGMTLGADDYITKPFSHEHLLGAIQARLQRHQQLELQRLRRYTQQFLTRQESNQRRVAMMLHQDIYQALAGLRLTFSLSEQLPSEMLVTTHRNLKSSIEQLLEQLERASQMLHPTILDHLGLLPGVLWLIERYQTQGLFIEFAHSGLDVAFEPSLSLIAFRIVQEALANILKHAGTPHAKVQIARHSGALHLQIVDNGHGFSLEQVLASDHYMGVSGIFERALAASGNTEIVTAPSQGTQIQCVLPIHASVNAPAMARPATADVMARLAANYRTEPDHSNAVENEIKIAIAAGSVMRMGLKLLLSYQPGFVVVEDVDQVDELLTAVKEVLFDVILVNPYGEASPPSQLIAQLVSTFPDRPVLVYAPWVESNYVVDALAAGASGVVSQHVSTAVLLDALTATFQGQRYLPPTLSLDKIEALLAAYREEEIEIEAYQTLTAREKEIFQYIAEGMTNAAIAHHLTISVRTVETHRANLMRKLGLASSHELIRYALRLGIVF